MRKHGCFPTFAANGSASSRVPGRIEFWNELPYNETGKLLRRKVREALAARAT